LTHYLLNFGDSWAAGQAIGGLYPTEKIYAGILANKLNSELIDLSQCSSSIHHMLFELRKFLKTDYQEDHTYSAIFFITAMERQIAINGRGHAIEMHAQNDRDKMYYQLTYTHQLGEWHLNNTLYVLQNLCTKYHIRDTYLLGWQKPTLLPEIDKSRFYKNAEENTMEILSANGKSGELFPGTIGNLTEISYTNDNFIPGDGHPSELGHKRIAEALYHWIHDSVNPAPKF